MKRNLLKKACCFLVVAAIATGAVSGCARGIANDENTLEISVFDGGWGTEYMYELKDAFKAVHPEIDVVITEEQLLGKTDATLRTDATTTDLYFSTDNVYGLMFGEGSILEGYDMIFEPLDEVYDYKPDGGEKTVRELNPAQELNHATYTYMKGNDEITHEYFIYPTGGFSGFIYNATKFEELNLTIPRTTDELYNVTCQQIKDKFTTQSRDKAAFSVSVKTAYSEYMVDVWWAQYETVKGQEDFCNGVYYENGVRKTGPKIFEEESRLYALQAYEKMINPEYGNSHANINTMTYIIDLAAEFGAKAVTTHIGVIPADKKTARYGVMLDAIAECGLYAKETGVTLAIETGPEIADTLLAFLKDTDGGVGVNLDPANFVMVTGQDPVEAVEKLKDYIVHTHVKDGKMLKKTDPEIIYDCFAKGGIESLNVADYFIETPVGKGDVNFPKYLAALKKAGYDGYLTIERETGADPAADITLAANYVRSALKNLQ